MEFNNNGFINTKDWNKSGAKFATKSMTFYNGKNEDGSYKKGFITLTAFGEQIELLESFADCNQKVTVKGDYRENESNGKKYPQWIVREIFSEDFIPTQKQETPFSNSNPMDISDSDLPF